MRSFKLCLKNKSNAIKAKRALLKKHKAEYAEAEQTLQFLKAEIEVTQREYHELKQEKRIIKKILVEMRPPPLRQCDAPEPEPEPEAPLQERRVSIKSIISTRSRADKITTHPPQCDCGNLLNNTPVYFAHGCCSRCQTTNHNSIKYLVCDSCDNEYCSNCMIHNKI